MNNRRAVVFLRYGSDTDFSHRFLRYKEIQEIVGFKLNTLRTMVKKFRDNGYSFERAPRQYRPQKLTGEVLEDITSKATLNMWKGRSLKERCRTIRFRYNVTVAPCTLSRVYR